MAHSREDGSLHFVSTVQWFGKAGGRVEPFRRTSKKNHPVQIIRKMPLAYDNQRAPESDSAISPAQSMWCATLLYWFL